MTKLNHHGWWKSKEQADEDSIKQRMIETCNDYKKDSKSRQIMTYYKASEEFYEFCTKGQISSWYAKARHQNQG